MYLECHYSAEEVGRNREDDAVGRMDLCRARASKIVEGSARRKTTAVCMKRSAQWPIYKVQRMMSQAMRLVAWTYSILRAIEGLV